MITLMCAYVFAPMIKQNNEKNVVVVVCVFVGSAVVLVYHLLAPTTHHFDQRRKMWCIGTSIKIFEFFSVWRGRS